MEGILEEFPLDIYQRNQDRIRDVNNKKFPNGSSRAVGMAAYGVIDGHGGSGLSCAFRKAKDDIDMLKSKGERGRAELVRQQYMNEHFLPALEVVINATSPDEVLNSAKILKELDKYVLLEGAGKGYTASYIRQAYGNQLGNREGRTEPSVRSEMIKINGLLDEGEIRSAYSMANKLKEKIDNGEAMADDVDYSLLGRIVSFYE